MKQKFIQLLKIILPVALGVYLVMHIYGQLDESQRQAVFNSIRKANYFWICVSVGMGLLSHYIRGYRWTFQMEALGYRTRSVNNFMAVMIGYMVNMILPRVGEVSRAAAVTKYENVPFQKSFGSILSERALDLIILLLICVITLALQYRLLQSFVDSVLLRLLGTLGSDALWMALIAAVAVLILAYFAYKKLRKYAFIAKLGGLVQGLSEGLQSIFKMEKRRQYVLATLAIWLLYIGMFWVCFYSLEETSTLGAKAIFAAFVVGSFAIVLIPGGIGAYPVGIMECLIIYGIAEETGFALGWIIWLSQTAMILVFGGASMILMPLYNKTETHALSRPSAS